MTMCFTFKLMSSQVRHTALISTLFALLMASGFVFTEINSIFFVSEKKTWSFKVRFFQLLFPVFKILFMVIKCVWVSSYCSVGQIFTSFFSGNSWIDSAYLSKKMRHIPDNQKLCICFQSTTIKKYMGQHEKYCRFHVLVENQKWH